MGRIYRCVVSQHSISITAGTGPTQSFLTSPGCVEGAVHETGEADDHSRPRDIAQCNGDALARRETYRRPSVDGEVPPVCSGSIETELRVNLEEVEVTRHRDRNITLVHHVNSRDDAMSHIMSCLNDGPRKPARLTTGYLYAAKGIRYDDQTSPVVERRLNPHFGQDIRNPFQHIVDAKDATTPLDRVDETQSVPSRLRSLIRDQGCSFGDIESQPPRPSSSRELGGRKEKKSIAFTRSESHYRSR